MGELFQIEIYHDGFSTTPLYTAIIDSDKPALTKSEIETELGRLKGRSSLTEREVAEAVLEGVRRTGGKVLLIPKIALIINNKR